MPTNPDSKSLKKIISQLQDTDSPYIFSLPDNIEQSVQMTNSLILIKQLRLLSTLDTEKSKFDREKWRAQVSKPLSHYTKLALTIYYFYLNSWAHC